MGYSRKNIPHVIFFIEKLQMSYSTGKIPAYSVVEYPYVYSVVEYPLAYYVEKFANSNSEKKYAMANSRRKFANEPVWQISERI